MRKQIVIRKVHRWIALVLFIQLFIWFVSGLYMVSIPIENVHGDHLIKPLPSTPLSTHNWMPLSELMHEIDEPVKNVSLRSRHNEPVYQIETSNNVYWFHGESGKPLAPLNRSDIETLASSLYAYNHPIHSIERLEKYPREIGGRNRPVWRVNFESMLNHTLYFEEMTGALIRKRSDIWRGFDFFWMLHIMDYDTRENVNNPLLILFSLTGLCFAVTGLWLLWIRLFQREGE